jgi:hypothetical protein
MFQDSVLELRTIENGVSFCSFWLGFSSYDRDQDHHFCQEKREIENLLRDIYSQLAGVRIHGGLVRGGRIARSPLGMDLAFELGLTLGATN